MYKQAYDINRKRSHNLNKILKIEKSTAELSYKGFMYIFLFVLLFILIVEVLIFDFWFYVIDIV